MECLVVKVQGDNFNDYMEFFKSLPLKEKQNIIIEQLKMLSTFTDLMCKEYRIPSDLIMNKEVLDVNKEDYTEDDFAEAIIVYINSIQNSLSDYNIGISKMLDK
jgi:hypothetical protein